MSAEKTVAIFAEMSRNSHFIAAIFAYKDVDKGRELGAVSFGENSGSVNQPKIIRLVQGLLKYSFWRRETEGQCGFQIGGFTESLIKIALLFILSSSHSFATDLHLFDMLKRMSDADRNQNYQGTFILRKGDDISTWRVAHGIGENGAWESIEMLNGEPKKVLRKNNQVVTVFPYQQLVTIRHTEKTRSFHPQLPKNIDQLEFLYSLNRLPDDRIASRAALVVELFPKDQYRYGYRYWIDKETGMLLRCDLVVKEGGQEKRVIEQMMFVSLDYLAEPPAPAFTLEQFAQYRQQVLDEAIIDVGQSAQQNWVVNALPEGFMQTQSIMRHAQPLVAGSHDSSVSSAETRPVPDLLHLVYSDGLASVSIFIKKNHRLNTPSQGATAMGAVNVFAHSVGNYFITVVGEVPAKTVALIARSTAKRR